MKYKWCKVSSNGDRAPYAIYRYGTKWAREIRFGISKDILGKFTLTFIDKEDTYSDEIIRNWKQLHVKHRIKHENGIFRLSNTTRKEAKKFVIAIYMELPFNDEMIQEIENMFRSRPLVYRESLMMDRLLSLIHQGGSERVLEEVIEKKDCNVLWSVSNIFKEREEWASACKCYEAILNIGNENDYREANFAMVHAIMNIFHSNQQNKDPLTYQQYCAQKLKYLFNMKNDIEAQRMINHIFEELSKGEFTATPEEIKLDANTIVKLAQQLRAVQERNKELQLQIKELQKQKQDLQEQTEVLCKENDFRRANKMLLQSLKDVATKVKNDPMLIKHSNVPVNAKLTKLERHYSNSL